MIGVGGWCLGLFGGDFYIDYVCKLITPIPIPGGLTMRYIGCAPDNGEVRRWYGWDTTPVGDGVYGVIAQTSVVAAGTRWPFFDYPLEPDS